MDGSPAPALHLCWCAQPSDPPTARSLYFIHVRTILHVLHIARASTPYSVLLLYVYDEFTMYIASDFGVSSAAWICVRLFVHAMLTHIHVFVTQNKKSGTAIGHCNGIVVVFCCCWVFAPMVKLLTFHQICSHTYLSNKEIG